MKRKTKTFYLKCGHLREIEGYVASQYKKSKKAYCLKCNRMRVIKSEKW